jgi:hypothetical protein
MGNIIWQEEDGVIYFTLSTKDESTGVRWRNRLRAKDVNVSEIAMSIMQSPEFTTTQSSVCEIAVLTGKLFTDNGRQTRNIQDMAASRGLLQPTADIGCLIRESLSDDDIEKMGLVDIVAMHKPISVRLYLREEQRLLAARAGGISQRNYLAGVEAVPYSNKPTNGGWRKIWWERCDGFAYIVPPNK